MRTIGVLAALGGVVVVNALEHAGSLPSSNAPTFTAKASDGKSYTLKSLTGDKTLVLYFISHTCPVNADAVQYYKSIADAYKGKVNFVGVIDGDEKTFKAWQKEHAVKFPVLYDKDMALIKSYKAAASPWIVVVNPKGEIAKTHTGYSIGQLSELNKLMASAAGVKAATINTKGAPASEMYG